MRWSPHISPAKNRFPFRSSSNKQRESIMLLGCDYNTLAYSYLIALETVLEGFFLSSQECVLDRDFVTGCHKRKKKRRKEAQKQQEESMRRKRNETRKKRKLEEMIVAGHGVEK